MPFRLLTLSAAIACALLASGCASRPVAESLTGYSDALVGVWSNAAQHAAAPPDMKARPSASNDLWLDAQTVTFSSAAQGPDGSSAVSAAWKSDNGARLETWTFRRGDGPVRLEITGAEPADLIGSNCALTVSGAGKGAWNAQTDPDRCRIESSQGPLGIDARITVMPTGVLVETVARLDNGEIAFRRPGGAPYDLRRVP